MEYANFMDALLDNDEHAEAIDRAIGSALESLINQGIIIDAFEMWDSLCSQAWAFHVKKEQCYS